MKPKELISCIITTFNRPDLVGSAIDSVLSQTYENIELIVVDDCSKTSYDSAMANYNNDPRVTFIRNEINMGLSASRNNGVKHSNGSYIAFLDDDDIWLPNKIESQLKILQNNSSYIACSSSHIESISKNIINHEVREYKLADIYIENLIGPPSKILVRSEVFNKVSFNETAKHAEDWDFYLKLLEYGIIYSIKEPLIIYNTGHFERMSNGFASYTVEEIQKKAYMTYVNKDKIGEANFNLRLTNYYFSNFKKRKNKLSFLIDVVKDVGFMTMMSVFTEKTLIIVKRKATNIIK
ncbi:glycosyltransferase family 2 protein [Paraglaciecola aquimarina]|uniref:Glycosyltransferase family 2 protein n=1 Tax=Paraglaciecola aquimarina TaxID=1235557 RepID=A0ABU3T147_9ALTE|nr:glycosyltransferase family 2 protein [Paraglaciecola aquimarina]MDU0355994.1 glycosyltransferase family 2 protein [Paraglaciecola aquimarina]